MYSDQSRGQQGDDMTRLIAMACLALTCFAGTVHADDPDVDVFELNIQFTIAGDLSDAWAASTRDWLNDQIAAAEALYNDTPRLHITRTFVDREALPDQEPGDLRFDDWDAYRKYMDEHFDVIATSRTSGTFQVVVVNSMCVGEGKDDNGDIVFDCDRAGVGFFPGWVQPFRKGRKNGIVMINRQNASRDWVLAHELGHVFSLIHTFRPYANVKAGMNCNREYRKVSKAARSELCNSCTVDRRVEDDYVFCDGSANVMDYCIAEDVFLNACQMSRAGKQRVNYMTGDGWTDYFKIKGTRGARICKKDVDCAGSEFCDKGTLTIGKNVCVAKRGAGEKCTRKKQCSSNRCRTGKCRG